MWEINLQNLKDLGILDIQVILISIIVIILSLLFLWNQCFRDYKKRDVLLIGLGGSGKTSIFSLLIMKVLLETQTSIKENIGLFNINRSSFLRIVDIPGHDCLRNRIFDSYRKDARAIVFVVDSLIIQDGYREITEYIYEILTDPIIYKNSPKILILCNKQDEIFAKDSRAIRSILEKEIDELYRTRANQLKDVDSNEKTYPFLGCDENSDKMFNFEESKFEVEFAECFTNNKDGDAKIDDLIKWLSKLE